MIAKKYTPENFYNGCLNRKIAENDIYIPNKANIKLSVLPYILNNHLSASMIGNFNTLTPKLETDVLAGGTRACMGFREAKEQEGKFIPNTLLNDDIRHYISPKLQVIAVFRKEKDDKEYKELTYKSNKVEWSKIKLPKEYKCLESLIFGDEPGGGGKAPINNIPDTPVNDANNKNNQTSSKEENNASPQPNKSCNEEKANSQPLSSSSNNPKYPQNCISKEITITQIEIDVSGLSNEEIGQQCKNIMINETGIEEYDVEDNSKESSIDEE